MLIIFLGNIANAQYGTVSGNTWTINNTPYQFVGGDVLETEARALAGGSFDWTSVTNNNPNGFAIYTSNAVSGLDIPVSRNGIPGMINITSTVDEPITYHISDQGQTYGGAYSGTTTYTTPEAARDAAEDIVTSGLTLYVYSIRTRNSRVIVTGTNYVLYESSEPGQPDPEGTGIEAPLPPGSFSMFETNSAWTYSEAQEAAYLIADSTIFVGYSSEREVYVLFFNGAFHDLQTQQAAIDYVACALDPATTPIINTNGTITCN